MSYGTMSYMNYELEYQSSASAPMICTVSLWKSSHACSDGARVLMRDSTVHHSGSTLVVVTVFRTILLYGTFVGLAVSAVFVARPLVFTACYIQ